ncbi:MAG: hypothetical protein [Bacteriophage sp.]|jgi:hypothetical protein|nr:MAG: hypothetical protein [Bacteriophage sp.]
MEVKNMVTMNKWGGANGTAEAEFCGLSTDNKPVDEGIPNGSSFFEMDTFKVYFFNKATKTWITEGGV